MALLDTIRYETSESFLIGKDDFTSFKTQIIRNVLANILSVAGMYVSIWLINLSSTTLC